MKQLAALALLISIYDIPHDPKNVVVEACDRTCVRIVVPRDQMDSESLILRLANLIESQTK